MILCARSVKIFSMSLSEFGISKEKKCHRKKPLFSTVKFKHFLKPVYSQIKLTLNCLIIRSQNL